MVIKQGSGVSGQMLDKSQLLRMYEQMETIRVFEERAGKEFAAGKVPGLVHLYAGEEAVAVGVCAHLTDDDFITSHHRGHGHCIAKGVDIREMVAELLGREAGACRGKGGSMHIADVHKGMLGGNGMGGGGLRLAVGGGWTARTNGKGQVAVCFFGDGASSNGTFHEGLNLAGIWKLPVVFVAENNGYAESTPVTYHMSCRDIADRAAGYNMPGVTVDGLDVLAVYEAAGEAIARARRGEGPSLIECKTYRYFGHFEGDTITYRTKDELEFYRGRDPILGLRRFMVERNIASEEELEAINEAMRQEMRRDPRVILMGEDVAGGAGVINFESEDAWGGVLGVTKGLVQEFGRNRVLDTPITEAGYIGAAVGAAATGLRPIAELMFIDFFGVCFDQIFDQGAKLRYMFGGKANCPLVIRTMIGAGMGAAGQHSGCHYSVFTHMPGIKTVIPSTPADAKGLLTAAIRDDDLVVVFENKMLYGMSGEVPEGEYIIPLVKSDINREGTYVTIVAISRMVHQALAAAEDLQAAGISAEIVDPRTLSPLDEDTILSSVAKTHRLVVVDEDNPRCSVATDIAALVADKAFTELDAPIKMVTAPHTPVPFSPPLEQFYIPSPERIVATVQELMG